MQKDNRHIMAVTVQKLENSRIFFLCKPSDTQSRGTLNQQVWKRDTGWKVAMSQERTGQSGVGNAAGSRSTKPKAG